jgi:DNA-binding NarL/FixJ family response regulator
MLVINNYSTPKERRVVECRKIGMTYKQIANEVQISVRNIKPMFVTAYFLTIIISKSLVRG